MIPGDGYCNGENCADVQCWKAATGMMRTSMNIFIVDVARSGSDDLSVAASWKRLLRIGNAVGTMNPSSPLKFVQLKKLLAQLSARKRQSRIRCDENYRSKITMPSELETKVTTNLSNMPCFDSVIEACWKWQVINALAAVEEHWLLLKWWTPASPTVGRRTRPRAAICWRAWDRMLTLNLTSEYRPAWILCWPVTSTTLRWHVCIWWSTLRHYRAIMLSRQHWQRLAEAAQRGFTHGEFAELTAHEAVMVIGPYDDLNCDYA